MQNPFSGMRFLFSGMQKIVTHFEFLRKCFFLKTDNKPNLIILKENLEKTKFPSFNQ
jgi:hypothetical protein